MIVVCSSFAGMVQNQYNFWIGLSMTKKGRFYKWVDGSEVKSTLTHRQNKHELGIAFPL